MFPFPAIEKRIKNVGFLVLHKHQASLGAAVELSVSFQGQDAIAVTTDGNGVVTTGDKKTTGTNVQALADMCKGKSVEGSWQVSLLNPPPSVSEVVGDILLLANYEYAPAAA